MMRSLVALAVGIVPWTAWGASAPPTETDAAEPTADPPSDAATSPTDPAPAETPAAAASTDASVGASTDSGAPELRARGTGDAAAEPAAAKPPKDPWKTLPWIKRWRPQRNTGEIGIFGGVFIPSERHDLYDPETRPYEPYWRAGADVGVRAGYYPLAPLGVEVEFNAMPTRLRNVTNDFAFIYGFQAHAVVQLPFYNIVPFFLAGGGLLGVSSHPFANGKDVDPAVHYGGGVKINVHKFVGFRIEARNILSATAALQNAGASHVQVLAGLTITVGRKPPKQPPPPPPPEDPDRDKDGIFNEVDKCPDDAGIEPHGCPDTDGDGFYDLIDKCPEVPGVAPDGCPVKDTDKDGFLDPDDDCVFEPETKNGFEDDDGCPDEVPPPIKRFSGTIDGIVFDLKKDTIKPSSRPILDDAVKVLKEFEDVRIKIVGHTDDIGTPEFNQDLSRRRAEAVKKYLVDAGIDPGRIETEGRGATEPKLPNTSEENRAKNRRIDFEILTRGPDDTAGTPSSGTDKPAAKKTTETVPAEGKPPTSSKRRKLDE